MAEASVGERRATITRSRMRPLRDFRWREIRTVFLQALKQWNTHNATRLGASLAFYSLLSLAPLLLVIVAIAGLVFGHSAAEHQAIRETQELVGPAAGKALAAFLEGSKHTTQGILATVFGFVTLLVSASGVVIELRDALNIIWDVPSPSMSWFGMVTSFIRERLFSFAIVCGIGFLLIISLVVSAWITAIDSLSGAIIPGEDMLLHAVNAVISFAVLTLLFAAIYKVLPDARIEWRDVIFGGAVTSLLFTVGKLALGIYLGRALYASMYGAAASVVILIVWVYYSGQIFFLGAEFTRAFAERYGSWRRAPGTAIGGTPAKAPGSSG